MKIVIKFAGALLENDATVRALAQQVAALCKDGHRILVIHGGGRLFTATLKRMGIELNKKVAAAISAQGQPAVGISAADAQCFTAEPMMHNEVEGGLGYVGYLTSMNTRFIESLWDEGWLPVAPCLGLGADNELYNINADHMAAACAEYLGADQLIYLTDVAGVLNGEQVLSAISCEEIERLVQCRVVSGGMILKLEAAKRAIEGGVREVRIVGGAAPDALLLASRSEELCSQNEESSVPGTRVIREPRDVAHRALSAA
jgi:acetylglutamate kinase